MSDPNPFISNGTCYYDKDEESRDSMLPCGNAALGHKPCCQAGDMCLDSNLCYNEGLDVTYRAGCSDSSFEDDSCRSLKDPGIVSHSLSPSPSTTFPCRALGQPENDGVAKPGAVDKIADEL